MSGFGKFIQGALGSTLIGTGINAIIGGFSSRKQRENAWDMWNAQNQYNTPGAQLARYKAAGINPAYGTAISSGDAGPVNAAAATVNTPEVPNVMVTQLQHQQLQNAKIEGQRLAELVKGVQLDNAYKANSMDARVEAPSIMNTLNFSKGRLQGTQASWAEQAAAGLDAMANNPFSASYARTMLLNRLGQSAYDLNVRNLFERINLFGLRKSILSQQADDLKFGLTNSTDPIIRFLARGMQSGHGTFSNSLLPYQAGLSGAEYLKDLLRLLPKFK